MSTIQRSIEITGSDGGFGRMAANLADELGRSFEEANQELERMSGNAEEFTDILGGRIQAIETSVQGAFSQMSRRMDQQKVYGNERLKQMRDEVTQAERTLKIESDRAKLAEKMRYQNKMRDLNDSKDATADDKKAAREEHGKNMQDIQEDTSIRLLQIRGLRRMLGEEASNDDSGGGRGSENNKEQERERGRGFNSGAVGGAFRNVMSGVLSGLGIAGLFSIAGFIGKMLNEGIELDNAESATRGLGMKNIGSGQAFGKKRAEMLQYSREVTTAAGSANYRASNNLAFEKRFSQDENSLLGLTAGLRTEGKGRRAGDVALEMLNYFKRSDLFNVKRGDFTQLSEKIQFNTRMLEMQGGQMADTNATTNAQLLELFGKNGIGDQRSMGYIESINSGITNPGNDFNKAFIFRSLREKNPDMSLFDLMKRQEQGIFGEGTFSQILGDLQKSFKGDQLKMSVGQLFNLKNFQAEQIAGMSAEDASRIGSQEDIQKYLKDKGEAPIEMGTGQGGAGVMSRRMAELNDWFAGNGVKAIRKIDEYITTFEKQGFGGLTSKMVSDITGAIDEGFKRATDYLKEQFSTDKIDERLGLGKGVPGQDGKDMEGTTTSVENLFKKGTFMGGNTEEQKKRWLEQGFNYDQNKIMPPALTTYEPSYSRSRSVRQKGSDGYEHEIPIDVGIMQGNELSGKYKGKKVEYEIPDKTYGELSASQIVQLFAYAVQNGLEKISLDQTKTIIEQGFQPSIEVMKALQIKDGQIKNKTYSTEK